MPSARGSGTLIDLFAGAGGLSCGLEQAGFRPVLANEMVSHKSPGNKSYCR